MRLIVGLGNPGQRYARNRHNIGFMAVDEIARVHRAAPFRRRFQGEAAEVMLGSERAILLKPQTFMNESGRSVGEAQRFFKIDPGRASGSRHHLVRCPCTCLERARYPDRQGWLVVTHAGLPRGGEVGRVKSRHLVVSRGVSIHLSNGRSGRL